MENQTEYTHINGANISSEDHRAENIVGAVSKSKIPKLAVGGTLVIAAGVILRQNGKALVGKALSATATAAGAAIKDSIGSKVGVLIGIIKK